MIYLVRHGQTQYNAAGRWQGQVDSPPTELGITQATAVAEKLKTLTQGSTTAIFASPLSRAHHTAKIIAKKVSSENDIILDPRLMEIGMGSWDGLTDYEIEKEWPDARAGLDRHEWFFHSPDGETYEDMSVRVEAVLNAIDNHNAQIKIIVSHGVTGRLIRGIHSKLSKEHSVRLDVPQDAIFKLFESGKIDRISVM